MILSWQRKKRRDTKKARLLSFYFQIALLMRSWHVENTKKSSKNLTLETRRVGLHDIIKISFDVRVDHFL